jgi:hypothetical protein
VVRTSRAPGYKSQVLCGKGLHSFRFQLNLSSSVHRVSQLTRECVLALLKLSSNAKECKPLLCGKLALVDLAGSERASETQNQGQKLRDGANINRSLLALANCINGGVCTPRGSPGYIRWR